MLIRPRHGLLTVVALWSLASPAIRAGGHTVALRTSDGVTLSASLYEASHQPAPAVVLVHMLTRTRADWAGVAEQLQQAGFIVLVPDLRGHGDSAGSYDPGGDLSILQLDVQAALGLLRARSDVSPGRLGIAGASLGANLAVLAAAADGGVRSVALLSPGLDYRGVRCDSAMRKYGERPALLVAASNDPYALRTVRSLATIGAPRDVLTLEGAGHGTAMLARDPDLAGRLVEWFKKTL